MVGAEAIDQGDCSDFKTNIPHSCERSPAIINLIPGRVPENQRFPGCCKGGLLSSHGLDKVAAFQVRVGHSGTSRKTVRVPKRFYLLGPGASYTCGSAIVVPPSVFLSDNGWRKTRTMMTWTVTCTYSPMLVSKNPNCCVSLSSFYNPKITPCSTCACGCKLELNCTKRGSEISTHSKPNSVTNGEAQLLQCTQHMCPIQVHWHFKNYSTAVLTLMSHFADDTGTLLQMKSWDGRRKLIERATEMFTDPLFLLKKLKRLETGNAKFHMAIKQLETLVSNQFNANWSDLPLDILNLIIGRLRWLDRIRIRAVCKAWSVPSTRIPAIDELPWAMNFRWRFASLSLIQGECRLLDPLSREYLVEERRRGMEFQLFLSASPCASSYGWVLFKGRYDIEGKQELLFLYSPFTTEVIKLPYIAEPLKFQVAALALNATSPKCTIFFLLSENGKISIKLCSAGDCSWKTFEFDGFRWFDRAVDAAYTNGVFYCVFEGGQLGAFNVELKGWTILVNHCPLSYYSLRHAKLIVSGADLQLLSNRSYLELLKLDFTKIDWVYENDLNNRVLFIGHTSFSVLAVGETNVLANTIFAASGSSMHPEVRFYGSTSPRESILYFSVSEVEALFELFKSISSSVVDDGLISMVRFFYSSVIPYIFFFSLCGLEQRISHAMPCELILGVLVYTPPLTYEALFADKTMRSGRQSEHNLLHLNFMTWVELVLSSCHEVKQMLIALLCESEMKLADETIEAILDKASFW
ncbi:hypothetical protein V6N13_026924 [Hibiscus sabdariffa]